MTLIIRLLGPVQISRDDQPVQIRGYQQVALLAYLLITGKAHTRQHLVDLLFDHSDDPRANLRWILSELRRVIGGDYILADRQEVAFNFESDYWLDVSAFEAGQVELYRGDFLEGLHLRDAFRFEDWAFFERERLRGRYQAALEQQLAMLEQQGDQAAVVETAHRLLRLDNLREDWQRALIGAYARLGKREAALAQFEQCRHALQTELGIAPAAETVALAQAVQQGQIGSPPAEVSSPQRLPEKSWSRLESLLEQPFQAAPQPTFQTVSHRRSLSWTLLGVIGAISLVAGLVVALSSFLDLNSRADVSSEATVTVETTLAAGATDPASGTGGEAAPQDLAGTTVTIVGAVPDEVVKLFEQSMQPFEDRTGINVIYSSAGESFETLIAASVKRGAPPDIADFPQPGYMADFARQGKLIDVRTFLSEDYLRRQYPHAFLELATVDGRMVGIWYEAGLKSLVWYPKPEFEAAGYKVPETWDELITLSDQMVADGRTPWCVGMQDGDASGWVGTDWVEDILLRTAPPETYDAWVRHELPFNSPEVRRAFEILAGIWFKEGYVYGGKANIAAENPADSSIHIFENPPGCYLHRQGSWTPQLFFPKTVRYGRDYDFFYLPPIDPQFGHPVLGGGKIFAMFNDRPEVREVMRYLTTVEAARGFVEAGGFIAPHRNVPLEWYPSPADLRFAQIILSADTYRFDGSDLMPGPVGTGSFWRGMVDWVNGADLETVLQEIDQSWPE
ncbi:MAG: extracellular solute-binding protein [Anaerolineales bacterium]|nr:extracellular solute-binding protein [Anaerolineales bacterium]